MLAEPELGDTADPHTLVRGDPAAVQTTIDHLTALAAGCATTAHGLEAIGVGAWTGTAAEAFRARLAEAPGRWSRASAAFRSAAQAWARFRIELVAAQEQAATAVARFGAAPVALAPGAAVASTAEAELAAARRLLADARRRRDRAADAAARAILAAAATAPDPPAGGVRRIAEAGDWVRARGNELGHIAEGVGEGVEDVVRLVRVANPADPYNVNHPGRMVANASTALAHTVDDVVHPLRQVAEFVGSGWGSDPARAFGHLLPTVLMAAAAGPSRSVVSASGPARTTGAASEVGRAAHVDRSPFDSAEPGRPAPPLWSDPRPTARPFEPARAPAATTSGPPASAAAPQVGTAAAPQAGGSDASTAAASDPNSPTPAATPRAMGQAKPGAADTVAAADHAAAERLEEIGRRLPTDPAKLMPTEVAEPEGPPQPGPHHDPERARRARVTRADKNFTSTRATRGNRKSHLDEHGHLVPANPAGAASVVDHVTGRRSAAKRDSPYSSFTAPGARAAVDFGGSVIEVDVVRLQADIDAGRVPDVEILPPHRVQAAIQADADRIAGRPVDLYVKKGQIPMVARSYGLDAETTAALRQRMIDMANAQRHHEWMIRGVVPGRYIVGPHPGRSHG